MTQRGALAFVGDGGSPQLLGEGLRDAGIRVIDCVAPQGLQKGTLRRHLGYLGLAIRALQMRAQVDGILIWQQYVGLYYIVLSCCWPSRRKVPVMLYYLIYKPTKRPALDRLKFAVMRRLVNARDVFRVYFLSRTDRLFGAAPPDARRVLMNCPFHSEFLERNAPALRQVPNQVFSGGLSNRNYRVIDVLARRLPEARFRVLARPEARRELSAANVAMVFDVYGDAFEELIATSEAVVIPLLDPDVVSGQLVIMAALQAGTPVFISRNSFIDDWLGADRPQGSVTQFDSVEQLADQLHAVLGQGDRDRRARARALYERHGDGNDIYREFAGAWAGLLAQPRAVRGEGLASTGDS